VRSVERNMLRFFRNVEFILVDMLNGDGEQTLSLILLFWNVS